MVQHLGNTMVVFSGVLCLLVIAGTIAGECLLALWAATSARPFFVRSLVIWAAVVPLIPIRAYWPALFFTMTAALTIFIVWLIRLCQSRFLPATGSFRALWRFGLADIFVLILFVATVISLGRYCQLPAVAYPFLPLFGLPFAPVLAFSFFSVAGPWRKGMIIATLMAIAVSATQLLNMRGQTLPSFIRVDLDPQSTAIQQIGIQTVLGAILVGLVALLIWLCKRLSVNTASRSRRIAILIALACLVAIGLLLVLLYSDLLWITIDPQFGKAVRLIGLHHVPPVTIAALAATATWLSALNWSDRTKPWRRFALVSARAAASILAIPIAWLYWQMLWLTPFPPPPTTEVNNYDRIISISKQLRARNPSFFNGRLPSDAQALIDEAVELLAQPNYIPTTALEAEARPSINRLSGHDVLALAGYLRECASRAEERADFDRGADYALAAVRYGTMFCRGGTSGHPHFAMYLEGRSLQWLATAARVISEYKRREVVQVLDRSLLERDDLETLRSRDRAYYGRMGGWEAKLTAVLGPSVPSYVPSVSEDEFYDQQLFLCSTLLMTAIRQYEARENKVPPDLVALTPDCMPRVPLDPFSGKPFIYQPSKTAFLLYSVGRDRIDNGGRFDAQKYHEDGYDVDLSH